MKGLNFIPKNVNMSSAAESLFRSWCKSFYGIHIKSGPVENLHTKPEKLSVAE
jgi:hypothetical protein